MALAVAAAVVVILVVAARLVVAVAVAVAVAMAAAAVVVAVVMMLVAALVRGGGASGGGGCGALLLSLLSAMLLIQRAVAWAHCELSARVRIHDDARPVGGERGSSAVVNARMHARRCCGDEQQVTYQDASKPWPLFPCAQTV